jgi:hypothetical protein
MISGNMIDFIDGMKHSPSRNYVIPGLTSWLIGKPSKEHGCVRMFTMSRHHEEPIVHHSHRFDFRCLVLNGMVSNHVWTRVFNTDDADLYEVSNLEFQGEIGKHTRTPVQRCYFRKHVSTFGAGDEYGMKAEHFHSIYFERGTSVLFFEGPNRLKISQILEPVVDNETIPLFKTENWMFRGDAE